MNWNLFDMRKKRDDRLTLYQIASSVAMGVYPEGYEIRWLTDPPWEKEYVCSGGIEIDREEIVPVPERVKVKMTCRVDMDNYNFYDMVAKREKVDFGEVWIRTVTMLDYVKFVYGKEDEWKVKVWRDWMIGKIEKGTKKKDVVFEVKCGMKDAGMMNLHNVLMKGMDIPEEEGKDTEVEVICDWWNIDT